MPASPGGFESRFFSAPDGLRLHMRDYAPRPVAGGGGHLPVVCLPGFARTCGDFHPLARALSEDTVQPRRVVSLDYRGRGLSARDPDPRNYDMFVENADVLSVLDAAGVGEAIFVATSRGGLHTFLLAAVRPSILRGVVLNDIGPIIEAAGLARIRAYVGKLPRPASWGEALAQVKRIAGGGFTNVSEEDWETFVRLTYEEQDGVLATRYDPALARSLESIDPDAPLPILWPQFEGLRHVPVLAIRGANSDLLSPSTLTEMASRHPDCETYIVEGQAHAPLLTDAASIARVKAFVERI